MNNRISPTTDLCGIFLHPSGHTRSPAVHNAAYAEMDINARYLAFDILPKDLETAIQGARALGIRQLAISVPHKEAVIRLLDDVDDTAKRIGAVNTITLEEKRLIGTNTDWIGAVRAIEEYTSLDGVKAVVLGAGGTARAVTFGLIERGANVTVLNRTPSRSHTLANDLGASSGGTLDEIVNIKADVIVNTTTVGMKSDISPIPPEGIASGSIVLDAVYEPEETRLLRDSRERGATPIGGKWMLIEQAMEQIRIWTGKNAPRNILIKAFDSI